ncbi:MAG: DUF4215 domain-containing protein [Candidatus Pacearchaeota archaeon]|nr:DUF4215 domain-containing protein [Candidatus Pacearchaeota archaeon]
MRVILIRYPDSPQPQLTREEIKNYFFGENNTINRYFKEASYEKTSINGSISNWYILNRTSEGDKNPNNAYCGSPSLFSDLDELIFYEGPKFLTYDHIYFFFISGATCPNFFAEGTTGKTSYSYNNQVYNVSVGWHDIKDINFSSELDPFLEIHEFGHNFGLGHANYLECENKNLSENCVIFYYGNLFDVMGSGQAIAKHFNAYSKELLGWIPPTDVLTIHGSEMYTLTPLEKTGAKIAKIPSFRIVNGTNYTGTYYLEYRIPYGFDVFETTYRISDRMKNGGLMVNWVQDEPLINRNGDYLTSSAPETYLLDVSPLERDFHPAKNSSGEPYDSLGASFLLPGDNFTTQNGMKISVISANSNELIFTAGTNRDMIPPSLNISLLSEKVVFISCQDNESGCNASSYKYYLNSYSGGRRVACPVDISSYTQNNPRSRRMVGGFSIILNSSSWVCGYVEDNAGNSGFSEPTWINIAQCGNKVIEGTEKCDDGNNISGDGCSSICKIEKKSPLKKFKDFFRKLF